MTARGFPSHFSSRCCCCDHVVMFFFLRSTLLLFVCAFQSSLLRAGHTRLSTPYQPLTSIVFNLSHSLSLCLFSFFLIPHEPSCLPELETSLSRSVVLFPHFSFSLPLSLSLCSCIRYFPVVCGGGRETAVLVRDQQSA